MLRSRIHAAAWIGVVGIVAAYYACDRRRRHEAAYLRVRLWRALVIARKFRRERNDARKKACDLDTAFQRAVEDWDSETTGEETSWEVN